MEVDSGGVVQSDSQIESAPEVLLPVLAPVGDWFVLEGGRLLHNVERGLTGESSGYCASDPSQCPPSAKTIPHKEFNAYNLHHIVVLYTIIRVNYVNGSNRFLAIPEYLLTSARFDPTLPSNPCLY